MVDQLVFGVGNKNVKGDFGMFMYGVMGKEFVYVFFVFQVVKVKLDLDVVKFVLLVDFEYKVMMMRIYSFRVLYMFIFYLFWFFFFICFLLMFVVFLLIFVIWDNLNFDKGDIGYVVIVLVFGKNLFIVLVMFELWF